MISSSSGIRLATFQAETLGTRILGTRVLLQTFGSGKTLEQMALDLRRELRTATHAFQALDEPAALLGIDDVHVFRADGAAIGFLQSVDDFAQSGLAVDHGRSPVRNTVSRSASVRP